MENQRENIDEITAIKALAFDEISYVCSNAASHEVEAERYNKIKAIVLDVKDRLQPPPFNKGELVEVSNDGSHWRLVRFSHKENGKYMCIEDDDDLPMIAEWKYCQKYGTLGKNEEVNHV